MFLNRVAMKHMVLFVFIVNILAFVVAVTSLRSVYIGDEFNDIPTDEFFLEKTLPTAFWLALVLQVSSILFLIILPEQRMWSTCILISCIFLAVSMRGILSFTMSKPYAYDVIKYYVPWMKVWLDEGVQLIPGPSIDTPLLYYYPNTHPLSFIIAYVFLRMDVPLDFFFIWSPLAIYAIEICLVYYISMELSCPGKKFGAMSAFLFASSTSSQFLTIWYSPQLVGSLFFLVSLLLCLKCSRVRKGNFRVVIAYAVTCATIFLLVITHHLSSAILILVLAGSFLATIFLKRYGRMQGTCRISAFWALYTCAVWYVYASIVYPYKIHDWIINLSLALLGMPQHAYQAVALNNFLWMPLIDQISFISFPILIHVFAAYELLKSAKGTSSNLPPVTIGTNGSLFGLLVLGLVIRGITYPFRIFEVMYIFNSPLAAKSLIELFLTGRSWKKNLVLVAVMTLVIFINTHWLFRIVQRTVPSWTSEYWLH